MQSSHGCNRPGDDFIDAESVFPSLGILDCNRKTFLLTFVEVRRRKFVGCYAAGDDIAGSVEAVFLSNLQTSQECDETCSLIIIHLREVLTIGLLQQFLDDCLHFIRGEMKQREKSIAYAVSRIGCQATIISDSLELGLKIILVIFLCHIIFCCKDNLSMDSIKIRYQKLRAAPIPLNISVRAVAMIPLYFSP